MRRRHRVGRGLLVAALAAVIAWVLLQLFVLQVFTVTETSMEPTLSSGARVLVLRPAVDRSLQTGDLVVVDVRGTFEPGQAVIGPLAGTMLAPANKGAYVVKRAIAGPGDRVTCCDPDGRLLVNQRPLDEPYLDPATEPSIDEFDVVVGPDRWWLMGDNRLVSEDSRAHLGSPGGGTVPADAVVGRVVGAVP